ncbi:putative small nuclear ribonucleoprotein-associated protein B [[Candida] railenensis]|uniref:Sm protein B n=1 Tax=[Candida] railenensis TaxID=45579 RepID=A0A9P0VX91_9ASCO|nr:putative small nuclear ribonucleoprotein-associated protein B [[Candida] railenensis]
MATPTKKTKMSDLINYRLKITTIDKRTFVGQLLAFDNHLNLVLSNTEESRITKKSYSDLKKGSITSDSIVEEKRSLGLIILRGEQVVSFNIESPPPLSVKARVLEKGKGISRPLKVPVSVKSKSLQGPIKTK